MEADQPLENQSALTLNCYEIDAKCVYNPDELHKCRYKRDLACTSAAAMVNRCTLEINRLTKQGEGNG